MTSPSLVTTQGDLSLCDCQNAWILCTTELNRSTLDVLWLERMVWFPANTLMCYFWSFLSQADPLRPWLLPVDRTFRATALILQLRFLIFDHEILHRFNYYAWRIKKGPPITKAGAKNSEPIKQQVDDQAIFLGSRTRDVRTVLIKVIYRRLELVVNW